MSAYLKILSFLAEGKKKMLIATIILIFSAACGVMPFLLFTKAGAKIINGISMDFSFIVGIAAGIAFFLILKTILLFQGLDLTHQVAYETLMKMRHKMTEKLLLLPMGTIEREGRGSIKKMFVEGIEDMELILAHSIPEGLSNIVAILLVLIFIFITDFRLGLMVFFNILLALFTVMMMMKKGVKKMPHYYASAKHMNETLVDYINGMEVVKVFNQTSVSFKKYFEAVTNYKDYTLDWTKDSLKAMSIYSVLFTAPLIWVVPFGGWFYLKGSLSLEKLLLVALLSMSIGIPLTRMVQFLPAIPILGEKSKNILAFLAQQELNIQQSLALPQTYDVSFEGVSFGYDASNEKNAVADLNFEAKPGTITALVGESGAGKSTITKLLIRFWDIQKGRISIGGVDIQSLSIDDLMAQISYVSQDNFLFNMTLRENLRIGKSDATEEELMNALQAANAAEFVLGLPEGLDTMAGLGGAKVSGGEMQRLSIARALLKDAPIIILDEATSFTDPENEEKIQAGLNALIRDKTVFVVAHRLSAIVNADRILVLKEGEIEAQGTHESLLATSSSYQKLWQASEKSKNWEIGGAENA